MAIQRATLNIVALLPHMEQIRAVSLDVLLKHMIPLTMKHFEYIILKTFGDKNEKHSMLHQDFVKKLAECKNEQEFQSLANDVKNTIELPTGLQQHTNMIQESVNI